jgi:nicotinate-nucleotide adenylyltransferase
MSIGVMGGTFDPIHNGHLAVAEAVTIELDLAEVLFMPAGQPWLKIENLVSPAEHRVNMVRLAITDKPLLKLSTMEMERPGPTYTVDTIAELRDRLGVEKDIFFVLSWGSLYELPQWKEPSRLTTLCRLVVVPRPGYPQPDLEEMEALIPGLFQRAVLMDKPIIDISATEIRDRVTRGLSISHLVPFPVECYIKQHSLYVVK